MTQLNYKLFFYIILTLSVTSCSNLTKDNLGNHNSDSSAQEDSHLIAADDDDDVIDAKAATISIPNDHPMIQKWITYFTVKDRERFQRFLDRGNAYRDVVQTILKENGLPMELYYLALIESGYSTHARSRARAVGAWQFMKGTAKNYDLEVNSFIDERRDPIRSTEAASRYLGDLFRVFQNWELALAAYNCGEHRILRAVMRGQKRSYWELIEAKLLPRETKNYVPKFMAAVLIGENPQYYGFNPPPLDNIYPSLEAIEIPSPVSLQKVSKLANIPYKELKEVNPHLIRGVTTPFSSTYEIWVPQSYTEGLKKTLPQIAKIKERNIKSRNEHSKTYVVRRGDNLYDIAKEHHITVNYLKRLNSLRSNRIYPGQKLRVRSKSYKRLANVGDTHTVRRGENLNLIAKKYNIPLKTLKDLNHLTSNRIYPGQKLNISINQEAKNLFHMVKRGENLSTIAEKYKTSYRKLKTLNNLKGSRIYSGQKIRIR